MNEDNILDSQIGDLGGSISGDGHSLGKINIRPNESLNEKEQSDLDSFLQKSHNMSPMRQSMIGAEDSNYGEISGGWIPIDRREMGIRSMFYPEDWEFRVKPATVEAIKNWSSIDEENISVTNRVFNEIMKQCVSIYTPTGKLPWSKVNSWDRFWFILKVREYTFVKGEAELNYDEECPYCDQTVFYDLKAKNLDYEFPDDEVVKNHYSIEERCWHIDPREYDLDRMPVKLYVPTLEKDDAILQWAIRENEKGKNLNEPFVRFLPWMLSKAPKDEQVLEKFIKECKRVFDSWDIDMFNFMDEVLKNIQLTPSEKLKAVCPNCGEEVHSSVRFQNGVKSLFAIPHKYRKFGTK